jgi:hypothetical protein
LYYTSNVNFNAIRFAAFHSLERLKRDPRFELCTVVSSLLFHVSVGFGYTPEPLRKLTISLAPFQRATSIHPAAGSFENRLAIPGMPVENPDKCQFLHQLSGATAFF